ncbi:MAG TPA: cellulose synthase operon protein YhjQ/BcsQ [Alphaproteobacteria bacterium]|nr:cellulose synthase operon protein YhjQ/BcsQ [Alphaproteobacteria bacterium]
MNAITALRGGEPERSGDAEAPPLVAFVHDEATRAALAAALDSSWPAASITFGGIDDAIEHLAQDPSPRFIIVDLTEVADPLAALDRLAEVCTPEAIVVALGEVNDIGFYRQLIARGVADYLTKPVSPEIFKACLQNAKKRGSESTAEKPAEGRGEIFAVAGARGGVGTTTIATTLAWIFAEEHGRRTMLVDLDLHWGAAALVFDIDASHGLCEALETPSRIDGLFMASAATNLGENLYLLCSEEPLDHSTAIRMGALERLSTELRRDFERIVLDVPRTDPDLLRHSFAEATGIVVATDLSLSGLRDTARLLALAKAAAPSVKPLVVANRVGGPRRGDVPLAEFQKSLGGVTLVSIPDDSKVVPAAINAGKPLAKAASGSKATAALRKLAAALSKPAAPEPKGLLGRLLGSGAPRRG